MSTVLWVHYFTDGRITSDQQDLWAMYRYSDRLDSLCAKIGVRPLSEFHDTTDAEANLGPAPDESAGTFDAYVRMASRGKWFSPEEGLEIIDRLLDALRQNPLRFGLLKDRYVEVMAELSACRQAIDFARQQRAKFNLCVVT